VGGERFDLIIVDESKSEKVAPLSRILPSGDDAVDIIAGRRTYLFLERQQQPAECEHRE